MSEIQRRDFLGAAAAAATAVVTRTGPAEAGDRPLGIRGNEGAKILGPTNPAREAHAVRLGAGAPCTLKGRCWRTSRFIRRRSCQPEMTPTAEPAGGREHKAISWHPRLAWRDHYLRWQAGQAAPSRAARRRGRSP